MNKKRLSNVAVDAVFDSVSIATTFQKDLAKAGVIFVQFPKQFKNIQFSQKIFRKCCSNREIIIFH